MKFGPGTPVFFVPYIHRLNLNRALKNFPLAATSLFIILLIPGLIDARAAFAALPPITTEITVSPTSISFGDRGIGGNFIQTVRITNNKSVELQLSRLSLSGYGFTLSNIPSSLKIGAYRSITFNVVFAPHSGTKYSATLRIYSGTTIIHEIPISGIGIWVTALSATPSQANFGSVPVGVSNSQTIRLENNLSVPVRLGPLTASGPGFTITNVPTDRTILSHGYVRFNVVFSPQSATTYVATLPLISDSVRVNSIRLSGTGIGSKTSLSLSTSSLSFGSQGIGTRVTLPVVLTSDGNSSVTISSISLYGGGFSASGIPNGTILTAGQYATLEVSFDPATAGASTGEIKIASTGMSVPSIVLSGTGVSTTSGSVSLHWDAVSDAAGYCVYRASKPGGPYTKVNSSMVPAAGYVDSTVARGITYYYVVTAVGSNQAESSYSNQAEAIVPANP